MRTFYISILIWNFVVLILYGTDKLRAKKKAKRISEKTLILSALPFGGVGAMFGMVLFNHKTSKMKFRLLIPFAVILNAVAVWAIYFFLIPS